MLSKTPSERPAHGGELAQLFEQISMVSGDERIAPLTPAQALTVHEQHIVSLLLVQSALSATNHAELERLVAPFGGRPLFMADGSAIVALTGSQAATDLAVRGARAALRIHQRFPQLALALVTGRGTVAAGTSTSGEVIDRAARLLRGDLSTAVLGPGQRPGSDATTTGDRPLRVDELTARLLEGRFVLGGVEDQWELLGERDEAAARTLLGKPTPCVGREAELASLEAMFLAAVDESSARLVLLTSPAGNGKSRLRQELIERLRRSGQVFELLSGWAEVTSAGAPLQVLANALRRSAGLQDGDPPDEQRRVLRERVARTAPPDEVQRIAEFLGELCGVPFPDEQSVQLRAARNDAQLLGDQMRRAFEDFLLAETAAGPVFLLLEDLHWSDPSSVAMVDALCRRLRERPLFVLATARPEVKERFPRLWAERDLHEIRLGPLSRRGAERLIRHALGAQAHPSLVEKILERAQGSAFFLEELIRSAAEQRGDLPETLLAMLQTRLEALEPEARLVLRAASILGETFWQEGVVELLAGSLPAPTVAFWIEQLTERELVQPLPTSRFRAARELTFRHALVREAAYSMLTAEDRELGHRLCAAWLTAQGEREPLRLAEHYQQGGEAERALPHYLAAAEQALAANDLDGVLRSAELAIGCGAVEATLGRLRALEAEAYNWRGQFHDAERTAEEAMRQLQPDDDGWAVAAGELGLALGVQGQAPRLAALGQALCDATVQTQGSVERRVVAMTRVAEQLIIVGETVLADALLARLTSVEPQLAERDPAALGRVLTVRALRARFAGRAEENLRIVEAAVAAFERAGDRRNLCMRRERLGYARLEIGDNELAAATLKEALAAAEQLGLRNVVLTAKHNLGLVLSRLQLHAEAERVERDAAESFTQLGNRRMAGASWEYLALILDGAARFAEAEVAARRALAVAQEAPLLPLNEAESLAILAQTLLHQGRGAEALAVASDGLAKLEALGGIDDGEAIIRLNYVEALLAVGQHDAAREAIERARARLLTRAGHFNDVAVQQKFLAAVPENARTLALWGELTEAAR